MISQRSFLLVIISCFISVQGLKCFICDMEFCEWMHPFYYKKYKDTFLTECGEKAISCASFTIGTTDPYSSQKEFWFQRFCLYPGDLTCIGIDPQDFPSSWPEEPEATHSIYFPGWVSCINAYRRGNYIPEIAQPPSDSLLRIRDKPISIHFEACKENITDACNVWHGHARPRVPIALAEGFPMDLHEKRKKNYKTRCYSCDTYDERRDMDNGDKICEYAYKMYNKTDRADVYGCTMLAIYKIAGGYSNHHFFTRDFWFPGDQWCLERSFNSTPTGRTLGGAGKANIRYLKRSTPGSSPCTNDDYSRALKGRDLSNNFEWIGQREFYSPQEFQDFLNCRTHVTNKLKLGNYRRLMRYNVDAAVNAWSGKSGVFASVGFRFCGPEDFCNDWTEAELYKKMVNPPPTSTTLKPDISTSTTPEPTPTKKDDDGCLKTGNEAAINNVSIFYCVIILAFLQVSIISCFSL